MVEGFEFGARAQAAGDDECVGSAVAEGVEDGEDVRAFEVTGGVGGCHDGQRPRGTARDAARDRGVDEKEIGSIEVLGVVKARAEAGDVAGRDGGADQQYSSAGKGVDCACFRGRKGGFDVRLVRDHEQADVDGFGGGGRGGGD